MDEVLQHPQTFAFLLLARMMGFFAFVQLFTPFSAIAQNSILQSALALGMTLPFVPDLIVSLPQAGNLDGFDFALQGLVAVLAGASFAVLCSVPIRIAAALGEVIDNTRGLSANGPLNPVTRDQATPLSSAVTATLSLVIFAFGWHLDILQDLYALVPTSDLNSLRASVQGDASIWVQSVEVLGTLLVRVLPLLGLLFTVDIALAFSTKNLKSSDMGGAENTIKTLIVAAWLVFLVRGLLSPDSLVGLRGAFHGLVSPLDKLLGIVFH